jgi:hypothetical protein
VFKITNAKTSKAIVPRNLSAATNAAPMADSFAPSCASAVWRTAAPLAASVVGGSAGFRPASGGPDVYGGASMICAYVWFSAAD